jgi:hypothetical protein
MGDKWKEEHPFEVWAMGVYNKMRYRTIGYKGFHNRGHWKGLELCPQDDFREWAEEQYDVWFKLNKKYKKTHSRKDAPSINRKDTSKGYIVDNLEIITVSENSRLSKKRGVKHAKKTNRKRNR